MQTTMMILGIASASVAGCSLGYWGLTQHEEQKIMRSCRLQAGAGDASSAEELFLQVDGIWRSIILFTLSSPRLTTKNTAPHPLSKIWFLQTQRLEGLLQKAGLAGKIDFEDCARVRKTLSLGCAGLGLILGMLFSEMLAGMLFCGGFLVGYHALQTALEQEVDARTSRVEQELSQLIEILVLGLRSGLSFDRSLELYCHYFSCGLSNLCERLQTQWNHGLISREEGLRALAGSYDSPLLERIIESIIRSLRFGTSMAETLSNAGTEIRTTRKTKLEEKVAKAPVKMLIPIGTLILPAMLILILGPIILELIGGF